VKLDIGGGLASWPGHTNLDPVHGQGTFRRRIQDGIPLRDATVESARCSHLMEHIPSGADRIAAFNEVWRVLEPGGTFEVIVPLFPCYGAIADPTHVSLWVEQSFWYFTGQMVAAADYGIRLWEPVAWSTRAWVWGDEGHWTGRKPR
jgi:hypothetical protein